MKFKFNITISQKDYIELNNFILTRSHYGKRQIKSSRIMLLIIFLVIILISLIGGKFSLDSFLGIIPAVVLGLLSQIFLVRFFNWSTKNHIMQLAKNSKMPYSPESVIEFYDDYLLEITDQNKTEHKYSGIERVSIVDYKWIYFHINNTMVYIVPIKSFESNAQFDEFFEFIKPKFSNIDIY